MDFEVRACASTDEVKHAVAPIAYYFGRSTPDEELSERLIRVLPAERVYAAWEGGRAVGGRGAFPFQLTVPGGRLPAAGVTVAGVLPTHRRRGVLRTMMRVLIDATRARGEPIAYLWATEDTIYGRFGFGLASFTAEIDLPRLLRRSAELSLTFTTAITFLLSIKTNRISKCPIDEMMCVSSVKHRITTIFLLQG